MLRLENYMKVIKTSNMYCAVLTLGLLQSIVGPCFLDLQHLINTDTEHVSHIFTARSTGYIFGAILSGIVLDVVPFRQAVLAVCCIVAGGSMVAVPWSQSFAALISFMAVNGIFLGAIETGTNVGVLSLWGKDSGPIFQGLQLTYGLGGFLSPLIAAPYLKYSLSNTPTASLVADSNQSFVDSTATGRLSIIHPTIGFNSTIDLSPANRTESDPQDDQGMPSLVYPFLICGLIACLVSILLTATSIVSPTDEVFKDDDKQDEGRRTRSFTCTVVTLTFLLIFLGNGMQMGYAQMLTSYAVKGGLRLTASQGSYLTSAFWAASEVARLASTFLAIRVSSLALIVGDLLLVSASALMLLLLMPGEAILWAATVVFGAGIGSLYASIVGWINSRVAVTSKIASVITVAAAAGDMVGPVTISYFMDTTPDVFVYAVVTACLLSWVVAVAKCTFLRRFDRKDHKESRGVYTIRTSSIIV